MSECISVIIPVYNVERYLPACLESIVNQTYHDLEILLTDDGSTDSSGAICDQYQERDSRIKVFHQKNAGAGAAKNTGLKNATGKYLVFLDSDDYLELDAMKYMHDTLQKEDADVVQCCYRDIFVDKAVNRGAIEKRRIMNQIEYLKLYASDWTAGLLWDKLYRRELFDGFFFEEGHVIDDEFFTYRGIMNAKKVVRDPKVVYNYRKRRSSVTLKPGQGERIILDKLAYLVPRRERIAARYPELKKDFDKNLLYMLLWLSKDPFVTEKCLKRIKQTFRETIGACVFCGAEWNVYLSLLQMYFTKNSTLVSKRNPYQDSIGMASCFE